MSKAGIGDLLLLSIGCNAVRIALESLDFSLTRSEGSTSSQCFVLSRGRTSPDPSRSCPGSQTSLDFPSLFSLKIASLSSFWSITTTPISPWIEAHSSASSARPASSRIGEPKAGLADLDTDRASVLISSKLLGLRKIFCGFEG